MIDYLKLAEEATDPRVKLMLVEEWMKQQKAPPDPEEELRRRILDCQKCPYRKNARRPVPWEGKLTKAKLLLIGEAPGADEDRLGKPFVGKSGQLLRVILAEAIRKLKLTDEDVVITNTVLCRPPANETPTREAKAACGPFLDEQLKLCPATVVVTLGATALQWLNPFGKVTEQHGRPFWLRSTADPGGFGRWVWPMYHPAAILRDPSKAGEFVQDWDAFVQQAQRWPWERNHLDPRPDLPEHELWVEILRDTYPNRVVWGVFHGLRCLGCSIVRREKVQNPDDICDQVGDVCVVRPPDCIFTAKEVHDMIRAALEHQELPGNILAKGVR